MIINEKRQEGNISLSHTQKFVLAKLLAAETPMVAYESVSAYDSQGDEGANVVAARDQLTRLGLMTYRQGEAAITDVGTASMTDANLVDEMGTLTDDGNIYAYATTPIEAEKELVTQQKSPQPEPDANPIDDQNAGADPMNSGGAALGGESGDAMSLEGLELFNDVHDRLKEKLFMEKIKQS